jgi:hypothetical protein
MSKKNILSLSIAAAFAVSGCGGGSGGGDSLANASANSAAPGDALKKAAAVGSQITVMARGSLAANVGPIMEVRVEGVLVARTEVRAAQYQAYQFSTPNRLANGAKVDVAFVNDGVIGGADRNLYVQSVAVDGKGQASTAPGVVYDRGAVDGIDVIAGREDMLWNGALRFVHSSNQGLTVRAKASLVGGQGALMTIRVNGQSISEFTVVNRDYEDFVFNLPENLPASSKLEIVFSNDLSTGSEDRNLYIESIAVNGVKQLSTAAGVTYDRGPVDGVDVLPGQADMLWNGALQFTLSPPPPPTTVRSGDTPPAGYTLCGLENQVCSINGTANVVYGAGSTWTAPRSVTGNLACDNGTFGDPAPGVVKACYVQASTQPPPPPPPPPDVVRLNAGVGVDQVQPTTEVAPLSNDGTGNFRTRCIPSHLANDDPIVFPGQAGRSHMHTFFGNTGANAFSTPESLRTTGNSTCRGGTINRSAYWVPTIIDTATNKPVIPDESDFYYKSSYFGVQPSQIQPMPVGLRMIAGDPRNSTANPDPFARLPFTWSCHNAGTNRGQTIPTCDVGDQVDMSINFPQCWDGVNLDSPDHKSHMAYATAGVGCPTSHPVALPEVTFKILYTVTQANQTATWRLSSDNYTGPAGYSAHGDWFNGWKQDISETWAINCVRAARDCHSHLLGDGRAMY